MGLTNSLASSICAEVSAVTLAVTGFDNYDMVESADSLQAGMYVSRGLFWQGLQPCISLVLMFAISYVGGAVLAELQCCSTAGLGQSMAGVQGCLHQLLLECTKDSDGGSKLSQKWHSQTGRCGYMQQILSSLARCKTYSLTESSKSAC